MKLLAFVLAAFSVNAVAGDYGCKFSQKMDQELALSSKVSKLEVDVGAGSLEIKGVDADSISINATACSNDKKAISRLKVLAETSSDQAKVKTEIPSSMFGKNANARIDLVLTVPNHLALDVDDSSGSIVVKNVADLKIDDSSGSITVKNVNGNLKIDDSSGSINVEKVKGTVELDDSSGSIQVKDVEESVIVHSDSSGSISVSNVSNDVLVVEDSSGSIMVDRVKGDFTVLRDSSGSINYENIGGKVKIPSNKLKKGGVNLVF